MRKKRGSHSHRSKPHDGYDFIPHSH